MEALFVRGLVDEILGAESSAAVCVLGDLNDVPGSVVLRVVQGEGPGSLFAVAEKCPLPERFSVMHGGHRAQLDHIFVSDALVPHVKRAWFVQEGLRDHGMNPEPITSDSDHAPLVVELI